MNVNHLTSTSATRKRIVPKHLTHISALVWMVILGMELTVKTKMNVKHLTSTSATRKRNVPTLLGHITVLVWMDIPVMVFLNVKHDLQSTTLIHQPKLALKKT